VAFWLLLFSHKLSEKFDRWKWKKEYSLRLALRQWGFSSVIARVSRKIHGKFPPLRLKKKKIWILYECLLERKGLFSWQKGQRSKSSSTHEVEEQGSSECPLASMWRATWHWSPLVFLGHMLPPAANGEGNDIPIKCLKGAVGVSYFCFKIFPPLCFVELPKALRKRASPPVMGAQSFPLPVAIMYSSVWDYRAQRENTITQKWTWKAKLFNHFLSLWTCHGLYSRYFHFLKHRTKETRGKVVVETRSSFP